MEKAYFNWSSGKDSALALYRAMQSERLSVEELFSVVSSGREKLSMHEVGVDLLKRQAEAIGIPLTVFRFDERWTGEAYRSAMAVEMGKYRERGITTALFGDLYLEQLRADRERKCRGSGMRAEFPLWGIPQREIMRELIALGFKAIVTCVDNAKLPDGYAGRIIDEDFIRALPADVDICGENGEYHSFVFDGPIFRRPVRFEIRRKYHRDYPEPDSEAAHRYCYIELE